MPSPPPSHQELPDVPLSTLPSEGMRAGPPKSQSWRIRYMLNERHVKEVRQHNSHHVQHEHPPHPVLHHAVDILPTPAAAQQVGLGAGRREEHTGDPDAAVRLGVLTVCTVRPRHAAALGRCGQQYTRITFSLSSTGIRTMPCPMRYQIAAQTCGRISGKRASTNTSTTIMSPSSKASPQVKHPTRSRCHIQVPISRVCTSNMSTLRTTLIL